MNRLVPAIAAMWGAVACTKQPGLTPSILSPAERGFLGCYRVGIATDSPIVPAQFDIRVDTVDGLNGRQVQLLTAIPDSVAGLGFFWATFGDSLAIRSWGGREGQGLRLRLGGSGDSLAGNATWYWQFDRSDRDSARAMAVRRSCE